MDINIKSPHSLPQLLASIPPTVSGMARSAGHYGSGSNSQQAVLGFTRHGEGRLAVYGDSNCLDSSHQRSSCFGLLTKAIQYVAEVSLSTLNPICDLDPLS